MDSLRLDQPDGFIALPPPLLRRCSFAGAMIAMMRTRPIIQVLSFPPCEDIHPVGEALWRDDAPEPFFLLHGRFAPLGPANVPALLSSRDGIAVTLNGLC